MGSIGEWGWLVNLLVKIGLRPDLKKLERGKWAIREHLQLVQSLVQEVKEDPDSHNEGILGHIALAFVWSVDAYDDVEKYLPNALENFETPLDLLKNLGSFAKKKDAESVLDIDHAAAREVLLEFLEEKADLLGAYYEDVCEQLAAARGNA